jgi:glutamate racemase
VAERYLAPLIAARVDTLVLGCTHYPLLHEILAEVMGPGVKLIDSAESVAADVSSGLDAERDGVASQHTEPHFFVTDAPGPFQGVAERFLGRPIARLEQVALAGD